MQLVTELKVCVCVCRHGWLKLKSLLPIHKDAELHSIEGRECILKKTKKQLDTFVVKHDVVVSLFSSEICEDSDWWDFLLSQHSLKPL